ncbi:MAG: chlorophyllide a reductase iron protein subunit X [Acidobacteriota bacterium]
MSARRVVAIYGKGGSGKSFITSNLSYYLASKSHRVLQIGCDPKHDSTALLFGGKSLPTLLEAWALRQEAKAADPVPPISEVVFKRHGVFAMELGGPEVGRGCGGRGITLSFDLLSQMGFADWEFDYIIYDFLGDVVCGGFGTPIAKSMVRDIILVGGNDHQALYVVNNLCGAVRYFAEQGGTTRVLGMIINRDDGSGWGERYAQEAGIDIITRIPLSDDIRSRSMAFQLIADDPRYRGYFEDVEWAILHGTPKLPKAVDFEAFSSDIMRTRNLGGLDPALEEDLMPSQLECMVL